MAHQHLRLIASSSWLSLALLGAACSLSDTSALSSGSGGAGRGGAGGSGGGGVAGSAGSAGSSASGGVAGSAGDGGSPASGGVAGSAGNPAAGTGGSAGLSCGTETCPSYQFAFISELPPCCPEGLENTCGVNADELSDFVPGLSGCVPVDAPGVVDDSCPPLDLLAAGATLPGCCTEDHVCGNVLDASLLGGPNLGCVSTEEDLDGGAVQACDGGLSGRGPE